MWKRFYFDGNQWAGYVESLEDWKELWAAYANPNISGPAPDAILDCHHHSENPLHFGFRVEFDGEKTLREFLVGNNMMELMEDALARED